MAIVLPSRVERRGAISIICTVPLPTGDTTAKPSPLTTAAPDSVLQLSSQTMREGVCAVATVVHSVNNNGRSFNANFIEFVLDYDIIDLSNSQKLKILFLFFFFKRAMPCKVLFVCEKFSKFAMPNGFLWLYGRHIESVFAVLNRKCGSFQCKRANERHLFLVYMLLVYPHQFF